VRRALEACVAGLIRIEACLTSPVQALHNAEGLGSKTAKQLPTLPGKHKFGAF
jgi:hypothetical protein